MDKRYQVFVSSTYIDLVQERSKVMHALMELDCIPSGMEFFPAIDEEQWLYIQRAIDECDYYVLILAARYGSVTSDNISYTEKEYDYAVAMKKPILALLHQDPGNIILDKTDKSDFLRTKLEEFREKVQTGRLTKYWNNSDDLPGKVALGLVQTIKKFPATGWVRGNQIRPELHMERVIELQTENEKLKESVASLMSASQKDTKGRSNTSLNFAQMNEETEFVLAGFSGNLIVVATWGEIFIVVSSTLEKSDHNTELATKKAVENLLRTKVPNEDRRSYSVSDSSIDKVLIQFRALGYIDLDDGVFSEKEYYLTSSGKEAMLSELAVKTKL